MKKSKFVVLFIIILSLCTINSFAEMTDKEYFFGGGYLFQNEFSKYGTDGNYADNYGLVHGLDLSFSYHSYKNEDYYLGFVYNFDFTYPFNCYTKSDKVQISLDPANSGFTGLIMDNAVGLQYRMYFDYYNRFECSAGIKVGFDLFNYAIKQDSPTTFLNLRLGLQTRFSYCHYVYDNIGFTCGLRLDYDFLSVASLMNSDKYKSYNVLQMMPIFAAILKF